MLFKKYEHVKIKDELEIGEFYGSEELEFTAEMAKAKGKDLYIKEVREGYYYLNILPDCGWVDEMLEIF